LTKEGRADGIAAQKAQCYFKNLPRQRAMIRRHATIRQQTCPIRFKKSV
jgi:hypothetical protein